MMPAPRAADGIDLGKTAGGLAESQPALAQADIAATGHHQVVGTDIGQRRESQDACYITHIALSLT